MIVGRAQDVAKEQSVTRRQDDATVRRVSIPGQKHLTYSQRIKL